MLTNDHTIARLAAINNSLLEWTVTALFHNRWHTVQVLNHALDLFILEPEYI